MKRAALLFVPLVLLCGCHPQNENSPPGPVSPPPRLFVESDVKPTAAPPSKAVLSLDGYKVPVVVKSRRNGDEFSIDLYSHDELFDYEKYVVGKESFSLSEGALENYQPAIPLLVFPFHFDEPERPWTGTLSSDLGPHPAHGTIGVSKDEIVWSGSSVQTVRVTVTIYLDDLQNPSLAKRTLEFWFSPTDGLLQRKFENASVREPVAE